MSAIAAKKRNKGPRLLLSREALARPLGRVCTIRDSDGSPEQSAAIFHFVDETIRQTDSIGSIGLVNE